MLKFLINLLLSPLIFLLALDGIAAFICKRMISGGFSGTESAVHSAKATVYFLIASGLTASVICVCMSIPLILLALIAKGRRRALLFTLIAIAAATLWRFYLNQPYIL